MKTIYCDESGFTGQNLWQIDQPYFVYSAVTVDEEEATEIIASARKTHRIQASELHALQLLKRESGRQAMKSILERLVPNSSIVIFHKRYSLACKMFEYLFEPAFSRGNSLFYSIGLHRFIANGLFAALLAEPSTTGPAFLGFQEIARTGDVSRFASIIDPLSGEGIESFLGQVATFVACNRKAIEEELSMSPDNGDVPTWFLELTMSGLTSLLGTLSGSEMIPLSVTCDESKPLLAQASMFNPMIGRTDAQEITFDGRTNQLTFNLQHEIRFGSSEKLMGLQLADLVAGAASFSLKKPDDEFAGFWRETCSGTIHGCSVMPDTDEFNLSTVRTVLNAFVLAELVERSVKGLDLIAGMPQFIRFARRAAVEFLKEEGDRLEAS